MSARRPQQVPPARKSSITCCFHDSLAYCWPSLGLGTPARAEILEGDVWGALKIEHYVLLP